MHAYRHQVYRAHHERCDNEHQEGLSLVFVVDPKTREVFYRGPINDKLGYETQKNNASAHYLKDALNTVLAGGKVDMDDVPDSKGCLVAIF